VLKIESNNAMETRSHVLKIESIIAMESQLQSIKIFKDCHNLND